MQVTNFSLFLFLKTFMIEGGVFMWVILVVWVIGIGISLYKLLSLSIFDINGPKLFDKIKGHVLQNQVNEAIALCSNSKALLPQIMRAGLTRANEERILIEDAISSSITEHTPQVAYQLPYISLTANISTLFGLLGTIQGLISSFAGVSDADPSLKSKILAEGIATAMNTTALGLVSAISLMVMYTIISSKATKINDQIDDACAKLVDLLSVKKRKG
jgi:biopolymer transport protein ExbB/TolQ